MMFCPACGNSLVIGEGPECLRFSCSTCPYVNNITEQIVKRNFVKKKDIGDILGGTGSWDNVDSTEVQCPKCGERRAYFMQIQTRSADEPMTTFYKCCNVNCTHQWRE